MDGQQEVRDQEDNAPVIDCINPAAAEEEEGDIGEKEKQQQQSEQEKKEDEEDDQRHQPTFAREEAKGGDDGLTTAPPAPVAATSVGSGKEPTRSEAKTQRQQEKKEEAAVVQQQKLDDEEAEMTIFYEVGLIRKFDRSSINARLECWFLMDSVWLNQWASYVQGRTTERPGPITNARLFEEGGGEGGEVGKLREGLRVGRDYRAVTPVTWCIYVVLYGRDHADDICRYAVDVYAPEVPLSKRKDMSMQGMVTARSEVGKMRAKIRELFPSPSSSQDGDGEEDDGDGSGDDGDGRRSIGRRCRKGRCCCCCVLGGVRRERAECLLFWMYTWCFRLSPWYYDRLDSMENRLSGGDDSISVEEGEEGAAGYGQRKAEEEEEGGDKKLLLQEERSKEEVVGGGAMKLSGLTTMELASGSSRGGGGGGGKKGHKLTAPRQDL